MLHLFPSPSEFSLLHKRAMAGDSGAMDGRNNLQICDNGDSYILTNRNDDFAIVSRAIAESEADCYAAVIMMLCAECNGRKVRGDLPYWFSFTGLVQLGQHWTINLKGPAMKNPAPLPETLAPLVRAIESRWKVSLARWFGARLLMPSDLPRLSRFALSFTSSKGDSLMELRHVDTCLPSYVLYHGNGPNKELFGISVCAGSRVWQVKADLVSAVESHGDKIAEAGKDSEALAAIQDWFNGLHPLKRFARLLPSRKELEGAEEWPQAWFVFAWGDVSWCRLRGLRKAD
jgi:hypothetical protein